MNEKLADYEQEIKRLNQQLNEQIAECSRYKEELALKQKTVKKVKFEESTQTSKILFRIAKTTNNQTWIDQKKEDLEYLIKEAEYDNFL